MSRLERFILRFCPAHALLQIEARELRHQIELADAKREMEDFRREQVRPTEKPIKRPVIRTTSWRQFQEKVADLQEKEQ